MSPSRFLEKLQSGKPLVLDGATGTNLQARGLPIGTPSDIWVLDSPVEVLRLHQDFVAAGSDLILTNTFGSSKLHLTQAGLGQRFEESNRRAAALAREAVEGTDVLVGGSLGPLGEMVEPVGTLSLEKAEAEYAAQARLLAEGGVDVLVVETQFDLNEALAAVRGAKSASDLPVVCSFSFDRGTRSMMGVKASQAAQAMVNTGIAAIGINCGRSLDENFTTLQELCGATTLPIWFKPNAGLPVSNPEGRLVYTTTPEDMGETAAKALVAGALFVGGCCGTSPNHLRAIAGSVKAL